MMRSKGARTRSLEQINKCRGRCNFEQEETALTVVFINPSAQSTGEVNSRGDRHELRAPQQPLHKAIAALSPTPRDIATTNPGWDQ